MTDGRNVGVALVGCGTVGAQVASLLVNDASLLTSRSGLTLSLRHVVDLDHTAAHAVGVDPSVCHGDLDKALADPNVDLVVELVGGTTFAKTLVEKALSAGKDVVTANKALLAHHGPELFALARANGRCIGFEASCVGGVPVVGALQTGLLANNIDALFGIVNGTCNFILSEMSAKGTAYADVLAQAQADGLAEADPTLDVTGMDSAHKLTILGSLAFGKNVSLDSIYCQGVDTLDVRDITFGKELGYTTKLLAIAMRQGDAISLRVHPAFIRNDHPLSSVAGPFNAACIYGHAVGHTMYYGRGAGGSATASAVVADLADVAMGNAGRRFELLGLWPDRTEPANLLAMEDIHGKYYLRFTCKNAPGVLGKVADTLGQCNISIAQMIQHNTPDADGCLPVVMTSHDATEGDVQKALTTIDALDVIAAPTVMIRIVAEHEETIG
jgi:homoserine dehydrogenase